MRERLSESEEELRDSLADALESHVARHDEGESDDRDRALAAADDVRPVVHSYTAQVIAELADLLPHSRQPVDLLLRWASDEYAKGKP